MKITDEARISWPASWRSLEGDAKLRRLRVRKIHHGGARRRTGGSGAATPLLSWKFEDGDNNNNNNNNNKRLSVSGGGAQVTPRRGEKSGELVAVSARKLAAGLWQLAAEVGLHSTGGGGAKWNCGVLDRLGFELHSWMQLPKSAIEGATKWDPGHTTLSKEVYHFHSHVKLCRTQQAPPLSSALQFELLKARNRGKELEIENKKSKKKLKHIVNKLNEERAFWTRKARKIVDELKGDLRRERRNRQQLDMLNSKLLGDLADTKASVRRYKQDYEKERKAREVLEKVCADLAKKVEEDMAEIEALDNECTKIRDEVDEERKMLQLAEVWREERVQMKLVDAKLILEEKYVEMNNLISGLETFLKSRNVTGDMIKISEAKMIERAIDTLKNHEIPKFPSESPLSNDKYAVAVGPETSRAKELGSDSFRKFTRNSNSKSFVDNDEGCKDANSMGTITQLDDSNHTCGGSENSVNRVVQTRYVKQNNDQRSPAFEASEISCVQQKHSKKKGTSTTLRKLWSSSPNNDEECKSNSPDENRRLSNGSSHNIDLASLEKVSAEVVTNSHNGLVNLSCSPVLGNHHIARAMKGCIEWPRGIPRQGLKAKLLEARLESQKSQIRNILKQRS